LTYSRKSSIIVCVYVKPHPESENYAPSLHLKPKEPPVPVRGDKTNGEASERQRTAGSDKKAFDRLEHLPTEKVYFKVILPMYMALLSASYCNENF
jgi:hypothetical protein